MIVNIPYHENYLITKDGKVYRDFDNEIVELPISKRKYKTVKIDNVIFRLDYLILTFIRNRMKESTTTIES